jgi:outer membrane protein assembly factor BamB
LIRPQSALLVAFWLFGSLSAQDVSDTPPPDDWPRFLGKTYDSVSKTTSSRIDWFTQPTLAWSLDVGEGYGIGSVSDNRYYHFDSVGSSERLRCLALDSGKQIWSRSQPQIYRDMFGYEDGPRSSPTIVNDKVITLGVTGQLTCRNLSDGTVLWSVNTSDQYGVVQNFFGVGTSPLVLGERVIVMVGGSPAEDQRVAPMRLDRVSPNGSALVAFDLQSGAEQWRCGNDLASYSSPRPIQLGGETLVLIFARGGLLAVDPVAGEVRWRFDHRADTIESVNAMVPVVDGDHVLISECYEVGSALLRVDRARPPQVVWRDPPRNRRIQSMRCHWSTPIQIDGYLYGCSGRNAPDSDFRCIDFKTGEVQWSDPRRMRLSLVRVGDMLVAMEERGVLQVIKANPNQLDVVAQWNLSVPQGNRPAIDYPCWAAPVVVGTKLLVRGTDRVICLDLARSKT